MGKIYIYSESFSEKMKKKLQTTLINWEENDYRCVWVTLTCAIGGCIMYCGATKAPGLDCTWYVVGDEATL